jgi:hypothetical protein
MRTVSCPIEKTSLNIARYNQDAKPIRWAYSNPANRITTDSTDTIH